MTCYMLQHIYAKTRKGQEEIVRPKFGLNPRQRRILVFVDGAKTLSGLLDQFPPQEMEDIIAALSDHRFIFLAREKPEVLASQTPYQSASQAYGWKKHCVTDTTNRHPDFKTRLTQNPDKVLHAKEFMLETAAIHLGILGREIVHHIESAQSSHSLASLAGQWTMALCASKTAARYAPLYLEHVKGILFEEHEEISVSDFS